MCVQKKGRRAHGGRARGKGDRNGGCSPVLFHYPIHFLSLLEPGIALCPAATLPRLTAVVPTSQGEHTMPLRRLVPLSLLAHKPHDHPLAFASQGPLLFAERSLVFAEIAHRSLSDVCNQ